MDRLDEFHPRIEREIKRIERNLIESLSKASRRGERPADANRHIIREKVLEVQRLGAEYACNFFNLKHFYAAEDFAEVGRVTDDVYRTYEYGGSIESAVITLTSVMLAKATVGKARQIYQKYKYILLDEFRIQNAAIMRMKSIQKFVEVPEIEGMDGDQPQQPAVMIEDLTPSGPVVGLFFVWRTMGDDKVCDICEPLDGAEWDFEDTTDEPLTPITDTHPRCRCRIDLERRTVSE